MRFPERAFILQRALIPWLATLAVLSLPSGRGYRGYDGHDGDYDGDHDNRREGQIAVCRLNSLPWSSRFGRPRGGPRADCGLAQNTRHVRVR
jgi:hypothetical protein